MNVTADLLRSVGADRKAFEARCEMITALVQRNDKAALEAICRIYDRQTADEQRTDATRHDNGIGFQQSDARFGGLVVRLYRRGAHIFPDKMERVRRMAVKYRAQLAVLSFLKDKRKAKLIVAKLDPQAALDAEGYIVCSACGSRKCPDGCCCAC